MFNVLRVPGGDYDDLELWAHASGSIEVQGDLNVKNKLTIIAEDSGTIVLPHTVKCDALVMKSRRSSNINSNDLRATSSFNLEVLKASTVSLYLVLTCPITGSVKESSTAHLWVSWPNGPKPIDVAVDGGSVFSERDWGRK